MLEFVPGSLLQLMDMCPQHSAPHEQLSSTPCGFDYHPSFDWQVLLGLSEGQQSIKTRMLDDDAYLSQGPQSWQYWAFCTYKVK